MKNRFLAKAGSAALAALTLAAGIGAPAQAATAPSPNAINTYSRAAVASAYANQWLPATTSAINWTGNASTCDPGTESADSLTKAAQGINFYRGMAGLDAISFTSSQNTLAQQTALLMEANQQINHYPSTSWKCYTAAGAQGAATSNLHGGTGGFTIPTASEPVKAYMDDTGPTNGPVGHRRWILNPDTVTMGMGTTNAYNALNVTGATTDPNRTSPTMIGFPGSGYFPQQLEPGGLWSLSSDQGVDFSGATVSVTNASGAPVSATVISTATGYGPNSISFQLSGISFASGTNESDYKVTVSNMKANNLPFSYTYTVRLFDATVSTSSVAPADPQPTLPTPATNIVAQTPTFTDTTYTIPSQTGVSYSVNGVATAAGTYKASSLINISATASSSSYVLLGQTTWSKDFTPAPVAQPITVTPIAPTFTATGYTIPFQTGVDYSVNGAPSLSGTYTSASLTTITAAAEAGYQLSGTTTWTKDFSPVTTTPTPTPTPTQSAIAIKAASLNGSLGAALGGEVYGLINGGGYQCFQLGCIIWSPATGAFVSKGGIRSEWQSTGFETGYLGYPTSDEIGGLKNGGVYQSYQGGAIVWSPATGAHASTGGIRAEWQSTGFENGYLGYPTSDEIRGLKNGGAYQMYQGGAIVWSPATGAHASTGGIRTQWQSTGFENGYLGYPTSDEIRGLKDGGAYQTYQGGAIVWSAATGAHASTGAIRGQWGSQGFENGYLGYPTTNEITGLKNGGVYQMYQGGAIVWSPASGAHISTGAIRSMWASQGFEQGRLGYPTSNEYSIGAGAVAQDYQGGTIKWGSMGTGITYK